MADWKRKMVMSFFFIQDSSVGGHLFLVCRGGEVVKSFVQWFLFVVTALSCLCAALYCMLAVEQLSLPEMQLSRASLTG